MFGGPPDLDWEIVSLEAERRSTQNVPTDPKDVPASTEESAWRIVTVADPEFSNKAKAGDFLIAGENMGFGRGHSYASAAIKTAGLAAVICESTNANFFRNSVWMGLPVVECPGIKKNVNDGDELELDLAAGVIKNLTTRAEFPFVPYPEELLEMLEDGGLYPHLKKQE